jgi:hypothetical protein
MTALVMFYFLHYKKIFIEDEMFEFNLEEFVRKSNNVIVEGKESKIKEQSIF